MGEVGAVDFLPVRIRDVRGLLVGPFDQPDARPVRDEPVQVSGRPFEIRLDADADAIVSFQQAFPDPEGIVRGVGILHVQPQDAPVRFRRVQDREHLRQRVGPVDEHAELGRLEADRAADALGPHRIEEAQVFPRRRLDRPFFAVVLAEIVDEGVHAAGVRVPRDSEGVLHLLSRDPLTGESQEEGHRTARTPPPAQIDSEKAAPSVRSACCTTCRT